ncbi:MAG: exosome complex protein Rrp42 [Nitrososphaerales archaeon]|nr:exosome complex protein Rrp42 [Nitrososphaerales archaeon]
MMSAVKRSMVVERLRKDQMVELLSKEKRLDNRGLLDLRNIVIETGVIERASGSAKVQVGNTQVIAGVKIETGEPFPDTPDKGLLVVNAEVLPLASAYAEPGPPDEDAIELARVVDRGVRESKMIDLSKLILIPGRKVHAVFVDVNVLNVDGNLFDATSYATVASIATAKMPKLFVDQNGQIKRTEEIIPLPIKSIPVSVTLARIGDVLLVDPTSEEEAVMDARITLVFDEEDNVCAGQKGQPGTLNFDQVKLAANIAKVKAREVRKIILGGITKDAKG